MRRVVVPFFFLFACGDNSVTPDASVRGDGGDPDARVVKPVAVAVAGDFGSPGVGTVSALNIDDLMMTQNVRPGAAQGDPVVREFGGYVYVVNRFGSNNITILDAKTFQLVDQISTGANSNPQDVAVVGSKLYIPTLGGKGVVVLNRTTNTTTEIDLATPLGDSDGKPDCNSVYAIGTKLYVACSMQTNFVSVLDSKIAVIDTGTDTYVSSVVTPYKNPINWFTRAPESSTYTGDLLIPFVPNFGDLTQGCLGRVSTGATLSVSCGLSHAELNGFANRTAVSSDGKLLYLAIAESFTVGKLYGFDLDTGMLWSAPISKPEHQIVDVAACPNGDVVATDQKPNMAGLRVYRETIERTTAPLSIGMPPTTNALTCYDAN